MKLMMNCDLQMSMSAAIANNVARWFMVQPVSVYDTIEEGVRKFCHPLKDEHGLVSLNDSDVSTLLQNIADALAEKHFRAFSTSEDRVKTHVEQGFKAFLIHTFKKQEAA